MSEFEKTGKSLDNHFNKINENFLKVSVSLKYLIENQEQLSNVSKAILDGQQRLETSQKETIALLNEKFDTLLSHIDFLVKGQENLKTEITVLNKHVRNHSEALETLL